MTRHEQLIAYLATLAALVVVWLAALFAATNGGLTGLEGLGLGTITGGLIGVLRSPAQRSMTIDNPPSNPVQTEEAKP